MYKSRNYREETSPRDSGSESTPLLSSEPRTSPEPVIFDDTETSDLDLTISRNHSLKYVTETHLKLRIFVLMYRVEEKRDCFYRDLRFLYLSLSPSRYRSIDANGYGTTAITSVLKRPPFLTRDNELLVPAAANPPCTVNLVHEKKNYDPRGIDLVRITHGVYIDNI